MICPFMPIPALTELRIFVYFVSQTITAPLFRHPLSASAREHMPTSYPKDTFKFALMCSSYAIDITYTMKF